ncbi:MAG: aliphatic sulfonate ABC transporter substrate-binding protein [Sporolactobacillus sp.]|jgi:sulfonate transport system substrate-binding protein|nr:aliphatic sulfonate ABC transporter substrate-binding protein [Sporolactobacillus sp.]MCI1881258.1 aliphatic sulfonate ABC transporter substrate-binding protein [Sporolactobacillus sp.]
MKKLTAIGAVVVLLLTAALSGCGSDQANGKGNSGETIVNIGIQQNVDPLLLAKEKGWFEAAYKQENAKVKWTEFQSGPPQIEAISAGHLDFSGVGNSPVISAQAANIPFTEIANTRTGGKSDALLVHKGSAIKRIKDLKGKKIAVAKGSSGFNLLYKTLEKAGLKDSDVQIIQLQPDEAQSAFNAKKVDAWAIWEPFVSFETIQHQAVVLTDEGRLDYLSPSFLLVRTQFAKDHPELVVTFLKVYEKARLWQNKHFDQSVAIYAKAKKLDKRVVARSLKNNPSINSPISNKIIRAQQQTADFQYGLKIIKQKIDTGKVVDNQYIKKALKP